MMTAEIFDYMEKLSSCPLCGSEKFILRHKPDICKCDRCKLCFRNPRPKQETIIACYDQGATFQQWQNELEIRSFLWNKRLALVQSYCRSGSLLDIGTGDGYFLNFAKKSFNIKATEVSKFGIEYAKSWGHIVHHGTIFDSEFDEKKYDIVTMWHVLEHLSEPGRALNRAISLLKPDGLLFIAVPNEISSLYAPSVLLKKSHPFGELICGGEIHLTHFTPRVLLNILKNRFGLQVLEFGVDDVHVHNRIKRRLGMRLNEMLNKLCGFHFDAAMVVVCRNHTEVPEGR